MDGLQADIILPPALEIELAKTELELSLEASILRGPKGDPGVDGADGAPGEKGDKGDPGDKGEKRACSG